jgi:hypothetical protein
VGCGTIVDVSIGKGRKRCGRQNRTRLFIRLLDGFGA